MGYRSDLVFALDKGLYLKYEMLANELPEILKTSKRLENEDGYFWVFRQWKWYSDFEEVVALEKFMNLLDDEQPDNKEITQIQDAVEGYGFIRIGEELEDIEERGQPWDFDLYINRDIDTSFGSVDALNEKEIN